MTRHASAYLFALILFTGQALHAQEVALSGTIVDIGGGPLAGVRVYLASLGLADTTGDDGAWSLQQGATPVNGPPVESPRVIQVSSDGKSFNFLSSLETHGSFVLFDILGLAEGHVYTGRLRKGDNRVPCPLLAGMNGIHFLKADMDGWSGVLRLTMINGTVRSILQSEVKKPEGRTPLAKAGFVDWVRAGKEGYNTASKQLSSYSGREDITLYALGGYFVDAVDGDDMNAGTAPDAPWKTVDKVNATVFQPGDNIYFKRGTSYSKGFSLRGNGAEGSPVTVSAYGEGNPPSFTNPDNTALDGNCIRLTGDYQLVENLYFHSTQPRAFGGYEGVWVMGAVRVDPGADHAVVRFNEFNDCTIGINVMGEFALVANNYIHDCNRPIASSWGPIGIRAGIGNLEIAWNTIRNQISWGGSWGADGGAIEIDDGRNHHRNIFIHHNKTSGNCGFLETSYNHDICNNMSCDPENRIFDSLVIAYNIAQDYRTFTQLWAPTRHSYIENNTVIRTLEDANMESNVFVERDADALAVESPCKIRNNIVVTVNKPTRWGTGTKIYWFSDNQAAVISPSHNLFYNLDGTGFDWEGVLGTDYTVGEFFGDPLFADMENGNFHLTENSPARDQGTIGLFDYDITGSPVEEPRDIGAFEWRP